MPTAICPSLGSGKKLGSERGETAVCGPGTGSREQFARAKKKPPLLMRERKRDYAGACGLFFVFVILLSTFCIVPSDSAPVNDLIQNFKKKYVVANPGVLQCGIGSLGRQDVPGRHLGASLLPKAPTRFRRPRPPSCHIFLVLSPRASARSCTVQSSPGGLFSAYPCREGFP
jgi:hypothetical protein